MAVTATDSYCVQRTTAVAAILTTLTLTLPTTHHARPLSPAAPCTLHLHLHLHCTAPAPLDALLLPAET